GAVDAAAALAALFGRAFLLVDHDGDPGDAAELLLDAEKIVAVAHLDAADLGGGAVPADLAGRVAGDHDPGGALAQQQLGQDGGGQPADGPLPAGHGDRRVEQDLVGDVHPGGDRGPDRQRARVRVGAVAEVLDQVRGVHEGRHADPLRPFAAHLGQPDYVA